jgi:hypothetical protein
MMLSGAVGIGLPMAVAIIWVFLNPFHRSRRLSQSMISSSIATSYDISWRSFSLALPWQ